MCTRPGIIYVDQNPVTVQCRKCDECIRHRKRRWIGRLLAEQATSEAVWFTTLTYAGGYDNYKAYLLDYRHVQDMFKKMRHKGHRFKYLCVGEYGERKGRAHWHIMIFWESQPPDVPMFERMQWEYWPHGHTQHEIPRKAHAAAVYLMDYMNKSNLIGNALKYSTGLGRKYLEGYARNHARNHLPLFPKGNTYTVIESGQNARSGKPFYYPCERDSSIYQQMLEAWFDEWVRYNPDQPVALSPDTEEWLSEITQDTSKLPLHWQEYLSRVYGFEPVADLPRIQSIVFGLPERNDITITAHWAGITLAYHNHEGVIQWQSDLQSRAAGAALIEGHLSPDVMNEIRDRLEEYRPRLERLAQVSREDQQRAIAEYRLRKKRKSKQAQSPPHSNGKKPPGGLLTQPKRAAGASRLNPR